MKAIPGFTAELSTTRIPSVRATVQYQPLPQSLLYPELKIDWERARKAMGCALIIGVGAAAGGVIGGLAGAGVAAEIGCFNKEGPAFF